MTTEFESVATVMPDSQDSPPWNEKLAQQIASEDGLGELTEAHWKVIHTLRDHFIQYGAMPPMRLACGVNDLDPHCGETLFHGTHEAWHVAGLPDPGSEAMSYM